MTLLASEHLATVQDIVYEGSIPYYGLFFMTTLALWIGHQLNIAGNGYSTGWESLNLPIIAVDSSSTANGRGDLLRPIEHAYVLQQEGAVHGGGTAAAGDGGAAGGAGGGRAGAEPERGNPLRASREHG